jgi:hypothetical protein
MCALFSVLLKSGERKGSYLIICDCWLYLLQIAKKWKWNNPSSGKKKKQINSKAQASVARLMLFDLGLEQIENIQNGETNRKEVHVGDYCCQMKCQFHQCC